MKTKTVKIYLTIVKKKSPYLACPWIRHLYERINITSKVDFVFNSTYYYAYGCWNKAITSVLMLMCTYMLYLTTYYFCALYKANVCVNLSLNNLHYYCKDVTCIKHKRFRLFQVVVHILHFRFKKKQKQILSKPST